MFGIKLKILKRSGTVYYFRGSACEYKHIWYQIKGLYKTLRKYIIYDFIVALYGVILTLTQNGLTNVWYHIEGLEEIFNIIRHK